MMKRTLTAAALAAAIAAPALAQTAKPDPMAKPATPPSVESSMPSTATAQPNFVQNQNATDWRGSKLIGATVYGPDNASIGSINDVLIANDGSVNAAVIGVGGFLGVGEKDVAIPFDKLTITRSANSSSIDKVTVSYTKDELKNAPKFAYFEGTPSPTTGSGSSMTDKIKSLNPLSDSKK